MLTHRIAKYIWTYPASLLVLLLAGEDLPTWHPFIIIAMVLAVGGVVGYVADVIVSSMKSKRLEM